MSFFKEVIDQIANMEISTKNFLKSEEFEVEKVLVEELEPTTQRVWCLYLFLYKTHLEKQEELNLAPNGARKIPRLKAEVKRLKNRSLMMKSLFWSHCQFHYPKTHPLGSLELPDNVRITMKWSLVEIKEGK